MVARARTEDESYEDYRVNLIGENIVEKQEKKGRKVIFESVTYESLPNDVPVKHTHTYKKPKEN